MSCDHKFGDSPRCLEGCGEPHPAFQGETFPPGGVPILLTLGFLFAELADETLPLGELLRLVRSVRQSVIEAQAGLAEDFIDTDIAPSAWRLVYELLSGKGTDRR